MSHAGEFLHFLLTAAVLTAARPIVQVKLIRSVDFVKKNASDTRVLCNKPKIIYLNYLVTNKNTI